MKINNISELVEKYSLNVNTDENLVSLCYNQIKTPNNDETSIYRGIVIDIDTGNVVCYPFYRFNDYDTKKNKLDLVNGKFYLKIDGSLVTLYNYKGVWKVSTKGTPTGKGRVEKDNDLTISQYYFDVLGDTSELNPDYYYITEFKFPSKSHHFIPCNTPVITLIGVRDSATMKELPLDMFKDLKCFNHLVPITFNSEKDLYDNIYNLNPYYDEGYVYVSNELDINGNYTRYKIKSPQFDLLSNLRKGDNINDESKRLNLVWLKKICIVNKHRDFLIKYPMFVDIVKEIDNSINLVRKEFNSSINLSKQELIQANISQMVKGYLILNIDKPKDIDTFIRNIDVRNLK